MPFSVPTSPAGSVGMNPERVVAPASKSVGVIGVDGPTMMVSSPDASSKRRGIVLFTRAEAVMKTASRSGARYSKAESG